MLMKTFTRDNGTKVKETGMAYLRKETEITLKVIGLMTREKDKDHTILVRRISFLLESGLMINLNVESIPKLRMKMLLLRKRNLIFSINILYLIFHRFSLLTQQDYSREQWKL